MKTSNFNINRVGALLKYDWMLNKSKISMAAILTVAIYACLVLLYFSSKSVFEFGVTDAFPVIMGTFINSFFSYAQIAMVFVITTMLHQKFTAPNSATSYLSMPGTSLEKFVVMISEYLLGALGVYVLFLICFYATMAICWFVAPQVDWFINAFGFLAPTNNFLDEITTSFGGSSFSDAMREIEEQDLGFLATSVTDILKAAVWVAPFSAMSKLLLYTNLNMCFRSNGQIKSIAVWMAATFAIALFCIFGMVIIFGHDIMLLNENGDAAAGAFLGDFAAIMNIVKYFMYCIPLFMIGLAYLFYYQISKKQAK